MNRRQFLTVATATTALSMMRLAAPSRAAAQRQTPIQRRQMLYEGTKDGKLYESSDGGKTWQLIADFGDHCAIDQIVVQRNGAVQVTVACAGYTFGLHSNNARMWRTV